MTCTSVMTPNASTSLTPYMTYCSTCMQSPSSSRPHSYHWSPELCVVNSYATSQGRSIPKSLFDRGSCSLSSSISQASGYMHGKARLKGGRSSWILSEWSMHPLKCTSFCSIPSSWFSYYCWKRSHTKSRYSSHPLSPPRFSFDIPSSSHRRSHTRSRMNSQNLPVVNEHT